MTDLKVIKGGKSANPNLAPASKVSPNNMSAFTLLDHKQYIEQIRDLYLQFAGTLDLAINALKTAGAPDTPDKPRRSRKPRVMST